MGYGGAAGWGAQRSWGCSRLQLPAVTAPASSTPPALPVALPALPTAGPGRRPVQLCAAAPGLSRFHTHCAQWGFLAIWDGGTYSVTHLLDRRFMCPLHATCLTLQGSSLQTGAHDDFPGVLIEGNRFIHPYLVFVPPPQVVLPGNNFPPHECPLFCFFIIIIFYLFILRQTEGA